MFFVPIQNGGQWRRITRRRHTLDDAVFTKIIQQLPDRGAITSSAQALLPSTSKVRFDSLLIQILDRESSSPQPLP